MMFICFLGPFFIINIFLGFLWPLPMPFNHQQWSVGSSYPPVSLFWPKTWPPKKNPTFVVTGQVMWGVLKKKGPRAPCLGMFRGFFLGWNKNEITKHSHSWGWISFLPWHNIRIPSFKQPGWLMDPIRIIFVSPLWVDVLGCHGMEVCKWWVRINGWFHQLINGLH